MPSSPRHVSLGFQGGQVLAMRVDDEELKKLNQALGGGGWHDISSEDGPIRVDLGKVVYVSAESNEPQVGFG
jgi:hypothetical protein